MQKVSLAAHKKRSKLERKSLGIFEKAKFRSFEKKDDEILLIV